MRKSRFTEEQIIAVLQEGEAGAKVDELCRRHAIRRETYSAGKKKYGGMGVSEARRLKQLEEENARLKANRRIRCSPARSAAARILIASPGKRGGPAWEWSHAGPGSILSTLYQVALSS